MALRCLLFSSDEKTGALVCQVLAGLGVEGESCAEGPAAVEKVIQESFQIVIIDWDMQPEAGLLLNTARERKATERPRRSRPLPRIWSSARGVPNGSTRH